MDVFGLSLQFVEKQLQERRRQGQKGPLFVLVSGPQGSGKSYSSGKVYESLSQKGVRVALTSIDDFYLTHHDQVELQTQHSDNKLLQGRGLPGTHDLQALKQVLRTITAGARDHDITTSPATVELPVYDKSLFNGEGDRAGSIKVNLPLECVIIEGWFLGFEPVSEESLRAAHQAAAGTDGTLAHHSVSHLRQVNQKLKEYGDLLWNNKDIDTVGIKFATDTVRNVYRWRLQQEHALLAVRGQGMTDMQVKAFVDRYMPCYELYYKRFIEPTTRFGNSTLTIQIDCDRAVVNHFISNS